ncbi:MAG: hypothetical protein CM15mV88_340 [Caudoviricetes sp.]|nr:MAG: hypothetical protein CM15mV88_340 [Caudoviricetes sp.]
MYHYLLIDVYTNTGSQKITKIRQKNFKIIRGGSSAGKTIAILMILIDYAIKNPYKEISIVAESIPHLRRGALKDFFKNNEGYI